MERSVYVVSLWFLDYFPGKHPQVSTGSRETDIQKVFEHSFKLVDMNRPTQHKKLVHE